MATTTTLFLSDGEARCFSGGGRRCWWGRRGHHAWLLRPRQALLVATARAPHVATLAEGRAAGGDGNGKVTGGRPHVWKKSLDVELTLSFNEIRIFIIAKGGSVQASSAKTNMLQEFVDGYRVENLVLVQFPLQGFIDFVPNGYKKSLEGKRSSLSDYYSGHYSSESFKDRGTHSRVHEQGMKLGEEDNLWQLKGSKVHLKGSVDRVVSAEQCNGSPELTKLNFW
ncbi:hypothetical protein Taro_004712 [Colocasia esculenta]|uniref:Uncharacterized protein n=1 Tax=Colocasia esculenta TaxID=4460 RepID=A0A843TN39_COLES|nr:hypothetical protein [Colocasia esculenta]